MIILTPTTALTASLVNNPGVDLPCLASYIDIGTATYSPNSNTTFLTFGFTATLAATPTSPLQREVKFLNIFNIHPSTTVTVKVFVGATQLLQVALIPLAALQYSDADGFKVMYPSGVNGAQGPQGVTGLNGNPGATGPQGPAADNSLMSTNPMFISRWRDIVRN